MPKVYDDAMKKLIAANAQDFVSLLQEGLRVDCLLPTELDAESIYADNLIKCWQEDGQPLLAHFEYQRNNDEHMGERILEYSLRASRLNGYLPVLSCVIYLKKDGTIPLSPFIRELPNGEEIIRFRYRILCIWEITVEELRAMGLPGLLPLLPLTKDGNRREVIDIMIEELVEAQKTESLWMGYMLASKVFTNDMKWLKRRFAMLNDFLKDSPVYQEFWAEAAAEGEARGKAKGRAEGKAEGIETGKMQALAQTRETLSQGLLNIVNTRFPDLKVLARVCVAELHDTNALSDLLIKVGMARTKREAKTILESYLEA